MNTKNTFINITCTIFIIVKHALPRYCSSNIFGGVFKLRQIYIFIYINKFNIIHRQFTVFATKRLNECLNWSINIR